MVVANHAPGDLLPFPGCWRLPDNYWRMSATFESTPRVTVARPSLFAMFVNVCILFLGFVALGRIVPACIEDTQADFACRVVQDHCVHHRGLFGFVANYSDSNFGVNMSYCGQVIGECEFERRCSENVGPDWFNRSLIAFKQKKGEVSAYIEARVPRNSWTLSLYEWAGYLISACAWFVGNVVLRIYSALVAFEKHCLRFVVLVFKRSGSKIFRLLKSVFYHIAAINYWTTITTTTLGLLITANGGHYDPLFNGVAQCVANGTSTSKMLTYNFVNRSVYVPMSTTVDVSGWGQVAKTVPSRVIAFWIVSGNQFRLLGMGYGECTLGLRIV